MLAPLKDYEMPKNFNNTFTRGLSAIALKQTGLKAEMESDQSVESEITTSNRPISARCYAAKGIPSL